MKALLFSVILIGISLPSIALAQAAGDLTVQKCEDAAKAKLATADETMGSSLDFIELTRCVALLAEEVVNLRGAQPEPTAIQATFADVAQGWSKYDGYVRFHYFKDSDGLVHLGGMMSGCPSTTPIFVLPEGYRPSERLIFSGVANDNSARIDVGNDGSVWFMQSNRWGYPPSAECENNAVVNKYLTLSTIQFLPAN